MQIVAGISLAIVGFIACYFLSTLICKISTKEMQEERIEYEQDYEKWKVYVEKAKAKLENPDANKETFTIGQRIWAFLTRVNLEPTLEELNEYDWEFLKQPLNLPVYDTKRKLFVGFAGLVLWGAAGYGYGLSVQLVIMIALYTMLIMITFVDMDAQIIPPIFNLIILGLGVIAIFTIPDIAMLDRFLGMFVISVPMLIIVMLVPGGFGGGDIKLMAAAGLLLGVKMTIFAFAIGLVLGGGYGIIALLTKKRGRKEHFAFGPCLCIGIAISIYGNMGIQMIDMYLRNFTH